MKNYYQAPALKSKFNSIAFYLSRVLAAFILFICLLNSSVLQAQSVDILRTQEKKKAEFEADKEIFVKDFIADKANLDKIKNRPNDEHDHEPLSDDHLIELAKYEAGMRYIVEHKQLYNEIYFGNSASMAGQTDTLVCDNGGFEDDFDFYKGYTSTYFTGSDSCTPYEFGLPSIFVQTTLPLLSRFEIVTSGPDPLIGIDKVKFGNKALKINSERGHVWPCRGDYGVDRLTKTFLVTESTRHFSVWYAVALENPSGHNNAQPFFSITCDLAPQNDLCFDASIINCEEDIPHYCHYDEIDVLDWACHYVNIPASEIGNMATVEITMGDCGEIGHFGYAYIDGFCESCVGSTLGSAELHDIQYDGKVGYISCNGDDLTICGSYTLPTLCDENWTLDSIALEASFSYSNVTIDHENNTFCFDFDLTNFTSMTCLELSIYAYYNSLGTVLPAVQSNVIELCQSDFNSASSQLQAFVQTCHDNGTFTDLSDDYYFVEVDISNVTNIDWDLYRQLSNPYPDESGVILIGEGNGDQYITLGPFLIQEGDWYLELDLGICNSTVFVEAPDYCSGCTKFHELEISNIKCHDTSPNDTWSFDIFVPISGLGLLIYTHPQGIGQFGNTETLYGFTISPQCIDITLEYLTINDPGYCKSTFTICPPKPCSDDSDCENLEVTVREIECVDKDSPFSIVLDVDNANGGYLCYRANQPILPATTVNPSPTQIVSGQSIGEFANGTNDVEIIVMVCDKPNCSGCEPTCYKVINVPEPDTCVSKRSKRISPSKIGTSEHNLSLLTNVIAEQNIEVRTTMQSTQYYIFDITGNLIKKDSFNGSSYSIEQDLPQGIYFFSYSDEQGKPKVIKFIKI